MKPLRAGGSDEELRQFFLEVVERNRSSTISGELPAEPQNDRDWGLT